jgi:alpha-1,3-rhamnosyl/mannosyltransferase
LEPRKNLPRLIQAWSQLTPADRGEHILAIAGGHGNPAIFSSHAKMEIPASVQLLGRVEERDLPDLYAGATAFAYPSLYEGFGLPPLEAMAVGTPVIVGNATSLPEVVGNAGLMVDPNSVIEIRDGLSRLLTDGDLRLRLSHAGKMRAAGFTWDKTGAQIWSLFKEII